MAKAPSYILEIAYTNPTPPSGFNQAGAATIAYGKTAPSPILGGAFPSVDALQEWKQVTAPEEDYEVELVGASGWVLNPMYSAGDLPFDHPFGFDWEFMMAVDYPDSPASTPDYRPLLARGNQVLHEEDDEIINRARDLQIPLAEGDDHIPSFLGVEIDQGLIPKTFSDEVTEGDRIAVFGRWIVDCGHAVQVSVPMPGAPTFRSEIHPPLLMASAKVASGSIMTGSPVGPQVTRVLFTSRPFLVGQRFSTDTSRIYDDAAPDDGPFVTHLMKEYSKVNATILGIPTESTMVEAHPKIKSWPFKGVYLAHFVVRPPTPAQTPHNIAGGIDVLSPHLAIAYQFTVRSGCTVQVISGGSDSVDVLIALNSGAYTSPPLPNRSDHTWSKDDLSALDTSGGAAITDVQWLSAIYQATNVAGGSVLSIPTVEVILGRGIKTDEYDYGPLRNINILSIDHAVAASANNIPVDQGIVEDDTQPYPIYGWLQASWVSASRHE